VAGEQLEGRIDRWGDLQQLAGFVDTDSVSSVLPLKVFGVEVAVVIACCLLLL